MKVTLPTIDLARAAAAAAGIAARKDTIPILTHVLLEASGQTLSISACDLDIELKTSLPADVATPGSLCVPAQVFSDILKRLPKGGEISFGLEATRLVIRSGRAHLAIDILPAEDFPRFDQGETRAEFVLTAPDLVQLFGSIRHAASTEETRYYLNGAFFHISSGDGPRLAAVATDGHRLGYAECAVPLGASAMPSVIISRKTVEEILRLAADTKDDILIKVGPDKFTAIFGATCLCSKLIDGSYPDYMRIIPRNNKHRFTINVPTCAAAVERVSSLKSDRGHPVKFAFSEGLLKLSLRGNNGEGRDEIEVDGDDRAEIGFQSRYVLEMLAAMNTETCVVEIEDPGSPALLRPLGRDGEYYVLMPVRV